MNHGNSELIARPSQRLGRPWPRPVRSRREISKTTSSYLSLYFFSQSSFTSKSVFGSCPVAAAEFPSLYELEKRKKMLFPIWLLADLSDPIGRYTATNKTMEPTHATTKQQQKSRKWLDEAIMMERNGRTIRSARNFHPFNASDTNKGRLLQLSIMFTIICRDISSEHIGLGRNET